LFKEESSRLPFEPINLIIGCLVINLISDEDMKIEISKWIHTTMETDREILIIGVKDFIKEKFILKVHIVIIINVIITILFYKNFFFFLVF